MRSILRRPLILIPLVLAGLFLAYLAAGFWLAPRLIRSSAQDWVATKLQHKTLSLGDIQFNPLNLTLDMANIALADTAAPAEPLVAVRHLRVNISAKSLLGFKPMLDAVTVDAPAINAVLRKDGSLNLIELVPPDDGKPTPEVWIGTLSVSDGSANFTDLRAAAPREKTLAPIAFSLANFATTRDAGGGFNLDAASTEGEKFHWAGKLSMAPLASSGAFTISALQLTSLYRFIDDRLPVALTAGTLDLAGDYVFSAPPAAKGKPAPFKLDSNVSQLRVAGLGVRTVDGDDIAVQSITLAPTRYSLGSDSATIGTLSVAGITAARRSGERASIDSLSLASTTVVPSKQLLDTGGLALSGITVTGRGKAGETVKLGQVTLAPSHIDAAARNAQVGTLGLSGFSAHAVVAADNSISVPGLYPLVLPKAKPSNAPPWHYSLAGVSLDDAALKLTLARTTPAKVINLAPVRLQMGAVTDAMDTAVPLSVSVGINKTARFAAIGRVNPAAQSAQFAIDLTGLPIADYVVLASTPPGVIVNSGTLGVKGKLDVAAGKREPDIRFAGDANVVGLDLNTRADNSDLLNWARLDVNGIDYASAPANLVIKRIVIDRPVSHVTIQSDAQINLQQAAGASAAAAPAAKPVGAKTIGNVRVQATMSSSLAQAGTLLPIKIGEVAFKDGTIAFADYSINPSFAAKIQGFTGSIRSLSTTPGTQAKFDLHGYVIDRFSPVTITGEANPFAYDANTDITAKFANIELPVFNPYSGQYAGYAIAKGKLSTDLHYKIVNRGLQADHHIVVDQLQWGEATGNKAKVPIPVKLATSLLKDSNGVITLDLPVTGSLDDPKFNIWPVVWQVVGNVLTKIVTAPFKLIGSLFAGADKAQYIVFLPGSAALAADNTTNLGALAKGLADRPEVKLDIPAGPAIKPDAEAMTTAKIETAALAAGKNAPATYADLSDGDKADRLKKVYKKAYGKGPDFPKDIPTANLVSSKETKATAAAAQVKWLETELRAKMAPTDAELAALGQARADAVKQALLADNALDPTRVFVNTGTSVVLKDDKIEMELKTKN